jgi:hypothetical protein
MSDLDQIVTVNATVTDKVPTKASFGIPMLVGYHTAWLDRAREYAEASEMLDDGFSVTSPLYLMAQALKAQDPAPPTFKVGRLGLPYTQTVQLIPTVTTEGFVYNFTIAGTAITYTVLAAATVATICTALELLVEAVTGITSTATTTEVTAVSVAGVLNSYAWERGLNVIETTVDPGFATDIAAIADEDNDWYGLAIDCNSDPIVKTAALWTEANGKQFVPMSGNWDIIDAGQTSDLASDLVALSYTRTSAIWHRFIGGTEWANAAWLAVQLGADPGKATPAYKTLAGITADDLRTGELSAIEAKRWTWYRSKHGVAITFEGKTPSGRFIDVTRFVDWLVETMQVDVYALLINNPKLPYTNAGISLIKGAIEGAIVKGQRVGGIADTPAPVVTAPDVLDTDASDRASRILRDINFTLRLSGAIHRAVVNGTISV